MEIYRGRDRASRPGPKDYFTGTVWQDVVVEAPEPARVRALRVHFAPGARTAWHTHPLGQTLHVLSGIGRVQVSGGPVHEIAAGDTVWIPPDAKHWHGAAPDHAMEHLAMQEAQNGSAVTWMDMVSDAEYATQPQS